MSLILLSIALIALLAVNAFFVLAEFAVVKVRASRIAELKAQGDRRAVLVERIQSKLDEFLSVCQVGITLASVALGMVGAALTNLIDGRPVGSTEFTLRAVLALVVSYVIVSGSHIVLAELVPKSVAIRFSDRAAMWCARPMMWFRTLFFPALYVLNWMANLILRAAGLPPAQAGEHHSEDEIRIILDQSQEHGMMSFRRLLFMENIFELGELKVRDAMRPRSQVRCLDPLAPWPDNLALIRTNRFSRFPLLDQTNPQRPLGVVHIKGLILDHVLAPGQEPDLKAHAKAYLTVTPDAMLETVLADMQRRRMQVALVLDGERWIGFLSMEDILEEIVGTITDEFEVDTPVLLADALSPARVVLGVEGGNVGQAVHVAINRLDPADLGHDKEAVISAVLERERLAATYLGQGIALPHARIANLPRPLMVLARSDLGIPVEGKPNERARLLFILLTPAGSPRVHQRLQARIAAVIDNSEYVEDRLMEAADGVEAYEIIRTGEQAAID
jgi:CBS domain containing-hemolysin-like protein/mannitol/fructose-specific phosphotransferase system IIA component (Ntr-type)